VIAALLRALEVASPRTGFMGIQTSQNPLDAFCDVASGLAVKAGYVRVQPVESPGVSLFPLPTHRWMYISDFNAAQDKWRLDMPPGV